MVTVRMVTNRDPGYGVELWADPHLETGSLVLGDGPHSYAENLAFLNPTKHSGPSRSPIPSVGKRESGQGTVALM